MTKADPLAPFSRAGGTDLVRGLHERAGDGNASPSSALPSRDRQVRTTGPERKKEASLARPAGPPATVGEEQAGLAVAGPWVRDFPGFFYPAA